MNELVFAASALLVLFGGAIPLATLLAKALLVLRRRRAPEITAYGSSTGYMTVTAPVVLPCLWLVSAALHQSEPGGALGACLQDHVWGPICVGAASVAVTIALFALVAALTTPGVLWRSARRGASRSLRAQRQRLSRVATGDPRLQPWLDRWIIVTGDVPPACVRGFVRPRVELSADYVDEIDDDMLRAVLLHEAEHVRCGDPLRGLVAEVALRLNPLSGLLRDEFARWRLAREVACDRHALVLGADRGALAQALVSGARFGTASATAPAMHSTQRDAVELRVRLVLDGDRPDCGCGSRRGVVRALAMVLAVVVWPHVLGSEPLDSFHRVIDGAANRVID